jgi:2-oxoglutarate ferredoxin oxidoreductase subunit beta
MAIQKIKPSSVKSGTPQDFMTNKVPTWCPSCGNFGMWTALTQALSGLGLKPYQVMMAFDIGCSGNGANWHRLYGFHSLHGRALPIAQAVKLANHDLTVIAMGGDGGSYGEGGNHFLHACRRNINLTMIVHNNERYSLTTGQTSPTTKTGDITKTSLTGAKEFPLNGLQIALTAGATFVARGYADEVSHLKELYQAAIKHPGFAVVEVIQPCVIFFDKKNLREDVTPRIYKLATTDWVTNNRSKAYVKAGEREKLPIGILFQETKPTFEAQHSQLQNGPLIRQSPKLNIATKLLADYR